MKRFVGWLRWLFLWADQRPMETLLSIYTFVWGFWLAMPWGIFNTSVAYRALARLADERAWALAALSVALLHLVSVILHWYRGRWLSGLLRLVFWTFLTVLYFLGNWQTLSWMTHGTLTAAMWWVFLRLRPEP